MNANEVAGILGVARDLRRRQMTGTDTQPFGGTLSEGAMRPLLEMTEMLWGSLWMSRLLPLVAEWGIANELAAGPRTVDDLAASTGVDSDALGRCLRALASRGVFAADDTGAYVNTPLSETLRDDIPVSLRGAAQMVGASWHRRAWDALPLATRSDSSLSAFEQAHGAQPFEYFGSHPHDAALFQTAMTAFSTFEAQAVAAAYDFRAIGTLVDVGGGHGLLLATVLSASPHLSGVLFELPFMAEGARALLAEHGLTGRCRIESGDFFESVPKGDAHFLKGIVHDWGDPAAVTILESCRRAVATGGRLLVAQEVLPGGNEPSFGKLLDIEMLMIGGRERTEADYRLLFEQAGYELTQIIPTAAPLHIIEGIAR